MTPHTKKYPRLRDGLGRGFLLSLLTAMSALSLLEGQIVSVSYQRDMVRGFIEQLKTSYAEAILPLYDEGGIRRLGTKGATIDEGNKEDEPTLPPLLPAEHMTTHSTGTTTERLLATITGNNLHQWLPFAPRTQHLLAQCQGLPPAHDTFVVAIFATPLRVAEPQILDDAQLSKSLCIRGPNVCLA